MFLLSILGAGLLLTPALARPATAPLSSILLARDESTAGYENIGQYAYIGCWTELNAGWRTLGQKSTAYNTMTLESCMADCAGYPLFGTEYGRECYCGNYFFGSVSQVDNSQCDMPCAGNRSETCGAGMRLSIYQLSEKSSSPAVAAAGPASASAPKSSTTVRPITSSSSVLNKVPATTSPISTSHVSIISSKIAPNEGSSTTPKAVISQTSHSSSSLHTTSASILHTTSVPNAHTTPTTTSKVASLLMSTSTAGPTPLSKTSSVAVHSPGSSTSSKSTPTSVRSTTTSNPVSTISLIHESAPSSNHAVSTSSSSAVVAHSVIPSSSVVASSPVITSKSVATPSSTTSSSSVATHSSALPSSSATLSSLLRTSSSTSSSAAAMSTAPHGKRGLAYNTPSYTSMFNGPNSSVSWGYNWGQASGSGFPSDYEFVPMLWSDAPDLTNSWFASVEAAIASGTTHVLAFNEPDLTSQSNMSPAQAAKSYMTWMQPLAGKVKLGAPAVSNGGSPEGLTWLGEFMGNCTECTIDFVPFHWYDAAWNYWYFKAYIEQFYQQIGLPLWITEFNGYGDDADVINFLELVMPWLDQLPYVQRYAWFGVFEGYLMSSDGSSLSDYGVVYTNYTSTTLAPYFAS